MYRILIGAFFHETNTFWPYPTGMAEFKKRNYYTGAAVLEKFRGTKTPLGGFIDVLGDAEVEIIPALAAIAEPYGKVTDEVVETVTTSFLRAIDAAGKIDGVLLQLHGAMVTRSDDDGEGAFLAALREKLGYDIPIVATLDLHADLSERMVNLATAFFPYREYPHADMYDRGVDAAHCILRTLRGDIHPVMRWQPTLILTSLIATSLKSYAPLRAAIDELYQDHRVLSANLLHGFYLADTADTRASALVVTDSAPELAQGGADALAAAAWENRVALSHIDTCTADEAICEAVASPGQPLLFADISDNPGIGSSCDGTHLLRALLAAGVQNVAYAEICDPETVEQCHRAGVGAAIPVRLGGKKDPTLLGEPICTSAYVKLLSDGCYRNRGPMHGGLMVDLHRSAVIVIDGISVIVGSIPTQCYDIEIFRSHGLMLEDYKLLVVKSSIHYRAAFAPYVKKMFSVAMPGALTLDPRMLRYVRCPHPLYPLDATEEVAK